MFLGLQMRCMEDTMKIRKSVQCRAAHVALLVVFAAMGSAAKMWAAEVGGTDQCSAPTVGVGTGTVGSANGSATCGILITVTGPGQATISAALGNGNPYDGDQDAARGRAVGRTHGSRS